MSNPVYLASEDTESRYDVYFQQQPSQSGFFGPAGSGPQIIGGALRLVNTTTGATVTVSSDFQNPIAVAAFNGARGGPGAGCRRNLPPPG